LDFRQDFFFDHSSKESLVSFCFSLAIRPLRTHGLLPRFPPPDHFENDNPPLSRTSEAFYVHFRIDSLPLVRGSLDPSFPPPLSDCLPLLSSSNACLECPRLRTPCPFLKKDPWTRFFFNIPPSMGLNEPWPDGVLSPVTSDTVICSQMVLPSPARSRWNFDGYNTL